jgi:hypothetical protein
MDEGPFANRGKVVQLFVKFKIRHQNPVNKDKKGKRREMKKRSGKLRKRPGK